MTPPSAKKRLASLSSKKPIARKSTPSTLIAAPATRLKSPEDGVIQKPVFRGVPKNLGRPADILADLLKEAPGDMAERKESVKRRLMRQKLDPETLIKALESMPLDQALKLIKVLAVGHHLRKNKGDISKTSRSLRISRQGLHYLLKEWAT